MEHHVTLIFVTVFLRLCVFMSGCYPEHSEATFGAWFTSACRKNTHKRPFLGTQTAEVRDIILQYSSVVVSSVAQPFVLTLNPRSLD